MRTVQEYMERGIKNYIPSNPAYLEVSLKNFNNVLQLNPHNLEAKYYQIRCLYNLPDTSENPSRTDQALQEAEKFLSAYPNSPISMISKSNILKDIKRYDEAKELWHKIINISDNTLNDSFSFLSKGLAYRDLKQNDEAKEYFIKALELNENNRLALYNLGISFYDDNQYEKSIELFHRYIKVVPNDHYGYKYLAHNYYDLDNNEEAIKYYEKTLELTGEENFKDFGHLSGAYTAAGCHSTDEHVKHYYLKQAYTTTLKQLNQIKDNLDLKIILLCQLGTDLYNLDEYEEAIEVIKEAQTLEIFQSPTYSTLNKGQKRFIKETFALKDQLEKQTLATKESVSFAIENNNEWTLKADKLKIINEVGNEKLYNYYNSFRQLFTQVMLSSFIEVEGRFQTQGIKGLSAGSNLLQQAATAVPGASLVISAIEQTISKAYEIHKENQAKHFIINVKTVGEGEILAQNIAIELTLAKAQEIREAENGRNKVLNMLFKLKDKAMVNMKDTPEKVLAYKDAGIVISLFKHGLVEKHPEISLADTLINDVLEFDTRLQAKKETMKLYEKIIEKTKPDVTCVVMAAPKIEFTDPLIKDAFKAGGLQLVKSLLDAFHPLKMSNTEGLNSYSDTVETNLSGIDLSTSFQPDLV